MHVTTFCRRFRHLGAGPPSSVIGYRRCPATDGGFTPLGLRWCLAWRLDVRPPPRGSLGEDYNRSSFAGAVADAWPALAPSSSTASCPVYEPPAVVGWTGQCRDRSARRPPVPYDHSPGDPCVVMEPLAWLSLQATNREVVQAAWWWCLADYIHRPVGSRRSVTRPVLNLIS